MKELSFQIIKVIFLADIELKAILLKKSTLSEPVKRRSRSHDDYILSTQKWSHRCEPIHLDFVIDRCFLFNIGSRTWQITLRLIIVKIRHEIMHRIIRKECLKFCCKLGSKGFIVRNHQSRLLNLLNNISHRKSLPSSCRTKQGYFLFPLIKSFRNLSDCFGLVTGRLISRFELKHHQKTQKIETNKAQKKRDFTRNYRDFSWDCKEGKRKENWLHSLLSLLLEEELSSSFFKKQTPLGESALMKSFEKLNYSISLYLGKKR